MAHVHIMYYTCTQLCGAAAAGRRATRARIAGPHHARWEAKPPAASQQAAATDRHHTGRLCGAHVCTPGQRHCQSAGWSSRSAERRWRQRAACMVRGPMPSGCVAAMQAGSNAEGSDLRWIRSGNQQAWIPRAIQQGAPNT